MSADRDCVDGLSRGMPPAPSSARRRLLRGSFAAPAVLTLSSGSALAQSSSLRCFASLPKGIDAPPDNYFRVQRYTHVTNTRLGGSVQIKLVEAAEIKTLGLNKFDAKGFTADKVWINVADGNKVSVGRTAPTKDTGKFVALRFAISGDATPVFTVTGLAKNATALTGTGSVLTHSCWASI